MDKQINHDKFHDESKTRTHRLSKLPDDETFSLFLNLLFTQFQDYFSSYEMGISVDRAKTEVL